MKILYVPLPTDDALPVMDKGAKFTAPADGEYVPVFFQNRSDAIAALELPPFTIPAEDPQDGSPVPDPTVIDASVLLVSIADDTFELLAADGSLLPNGQEGQFELYDVDAVNNAVEKMQLEACPIPDVQGTTLFLAICREDSHSGTQQQDGAHSTAMMISMRIAEMFTPDKQYRLYSSRDAALRNIGKVGVDDEVAVVAITVPAGFRTLVATCTKHPRVGYVVPGVLLDELRKQAILAMEIVSHEEVATTKNGG